MFEKPPHGTDCARCEKRGPYDDRHSNHAASTRCFWCLTFVCSEHAVRPFAPDIAVDSCTLCAVKVEKSITVHGFLKLPGDFEFGDWKRLYSSATFSGYGRAS